MSSNPNYFLIHGSFGSPFVNWLPWLRKQLRNQSKEVYTPDFPTGVGFQNYENWAKLLKVYLDAGLITEDTTIIAHSIAPVFICKFLIENKVKVKKLVFVCGFNNYLGIDDDYDNVNRGMYLENLSEVKKYCDEIICFYTKNDPYVSYEAEKRFADTIAAKQIIIDDGGHLNSESGYREFSALLEVI
ncbi:alpha/beta hydrolase [Congzhengia minquanensis]|uniref:Alpha/beta hydrolase n=1 Tax=Congzhengia minquanensis TaxID=2763657 RepID=A0A926DL85_9FIRM|nr:alpha/beta hydrolase [Congzhengia minquanensis]MBC8540088.1 alpha/beta hydrolase [Congzhengia minquanensis]